MSSGFDRKKAETFTINLMKDIGATMSIAMAYLGDELGIFKAMAGAGPLTVEELAGRTGLQPRYLQEWCAQMAASDYLEYDPASQSFLLPAEHAAPLAVEESPVFMGGFLTSLPSSFAAMDRLKDAFKHGGGIAYADFPVAALLGTERGFRPAYRNFLLQKWIPSIPGVREKLERGALAADVGCGAGVALTLLANAFPNSRFVGFDYHGPSIERARQNAEEAGCGDNLTFEVRSALDIPQDHRFDFITTFDCIHDMADPAGAIKAIHGALKPDGTYLLVDVNAAPTVEGNLNPLGRMMYGFSVLQCMTVSLALGGAGLGTCGLHEAKARELTQAAGFTHFQRLDDLTNEFNAFYEVRP